MTTPEEIIQDIADTLAQCDEEFIAEIANLVLTRKVRILEDGTLIQDPIY